MHTYSLDFEGDMKSWRRSVLILDPNFCLQLPDASPICTVMKRVACCFTGGKDSCLALHLLKAAGGDAGLGEEFEQQRLSADVCLLVLFAPAGGPEFKAHPIECIRLQVGGLAPTSYYTAQHGTWHQGCRASMAQTTEGRRLTAFQTPYPA